jgi:Helicase associated domain
VLRSVDLQLHNWCQHQRDRQQNGLLSLSKKKKLDDLGFCWQKISKRPVSDPCQSFPDVVWAQNVAIYRDFIKENGHSCVPQNGSFLSGWINRQQKLYRSGMLPKDRKDQLMEIGFQWSAVSLDKRTQPRYLPTCAQYRAPAPDRIKKD